MSGGERSRLLLAREFARVSNLLVLDEPTNDLDLETLDLLQEVIADYDGTVLIVSHDRDFLDRTVTHVVALDGSGTVDVVAGGYSDWEAKRDGVALLARSPAAQAKAAAAAPARKAVKLTYNEQRELDILPGRDRGARQGDRRGRGDARRPGALRPRSGALRPRQRRRRCDAGEAGRGRGALADAGSQGRGAGG